jgi:putative ABC transport system substrate-binding protein
MKRRDFVTLLGGAAAASWSPKARAQQPGSPRRIGVLIPQAENDPQGKTEVAIFQKALRDLGWTDGGTAQFQVRWAGSELSRIKSEGKELVAWQPDVILARTTPVTAALLQESRTIPIVFVNVSDPVGAGFAASVARPGGNVTGFTNVEQSLGGKWVELLREADPTVARITVLFDPKTSPEGGSYYLRLIQRAARSIGVETTAMPVENAAAIEPAFDALKGVPNVGMIVQPDVTTTSHRAVIIALAAKYGFPAVYPFSFFATDGGLASYGIDVTDGYKRAATYVHRILSGEKPGELPVQAPIKFELKVNLRTATALGLHLPAMLLGRADEVIE